ncbi:MAG TPA: universal stress protein [Chitinophagaceae bacterium]|nr:universal stress protein [Chitinophagaceae bacterium]
MTVLVPTDFSANSRAGIRFARQWAQQQPLNLLFLHVLHVARPPAWTQKQFEAQLRFELDAAREKLAAFAASELPVGQKRSFVVVPGISPDITILDFCRKRRSIDYICISTRGAGKLDKVLGTNTGNLITQSPVPVLAVPSGYRTRPIHKVLYATDLRNFTREFRRVTSFSAPLQAELDIYYAAGERGQPSVADAEKLLSRFRYPHGFRLHLSDYAGKRKLLDDIRKIVRLLRPEVTILFTRQSRSVLRKIFAPSKAETLSFELKAPLLVLKK